MQFVVPGDAYNIVDLTFTLLHLTGEDVPEELKAQERGQWQWRLSCMGRPLPGTALEDSAEELKGIANFEGASLNLLM